VSGPGPPPTDVSVAASIDWKLRGANWIDTGFRWGCVLGAGLIAVGMIGGVVVVGVRSLGGAGTIPGVAALGGFALFPAAVAAALFERWGIGEGGWWGAAVGRLSLGFPSTTGVMYGTFPVLSGLRFWHSRPVLFLFAPHRFVLVSRGWHPAILTTIVGYAAFCVATGAMGIADDPSVIGSVLAGLVPGAVLLALLAARRVEVHEISYDDVRGVEPVRVRVEFKLAGGPLAPGFTFRPYDTDLATFWAHAATRWPGVRWPGVETDAAEETPAAGDDASDEAADLLSRLQQRYEE
jgi:hypothetical protein